MIMALRRYLSSRICQVTVWIAFGCAIAGGVFFSGTLAPPAPVDLAQHDTSAPGHDPETCLACRTLQKPFPMEYGRRLVREAGLAKGQSTTSSPPQ
jgi:hypothetical protein